MTGMIFNIKALSLDELAEEFVRMGLRKYRTAQVFDWIYRKHAQSFGQMTNIAKPERALLENCFSIPEIAAVRRETSTDGTEKFLFGLEDGHAVESVLIPDEDRLTLCISSQAGCQQAC